ncbi:MAG: hypothetical protein GX070_04185 [Alcaligenaceae bacterium]|nr:hypothetical protein [Alcaligenaceae bacterium]
MNTAMNSHISLSDNLERELISHAISEERPVNIVKLFKAVTSSIATAFVVFVELFKDTEKAIDLADSQDHNTGGFSW